MSFDTIFSLFEDWSQDEATTVEFVVLSGRKLL